MISNYKVAFAGVFALTTCFSVCAQESGATAKPGMNQLKFSAPPESIHSALLTKQNYGEDIETIVDIEKDKGNKKASSKSVIKDALSVAVIDINGDGEAEFVVKGQHSAFCGSGGCDVSVLQKQDGAYKKVFSINLQDESVGVFVDSAKSAYYLTGQGKKFPLKLAAQSAAVPASGDFKVVALSKLEEGAGAGCSIVDERGKTILDSRIKINNALINIKQVALTATAIKWQGDGLEIVFSIPKGKLLQNPNGYTGGKGVVGKLTVNYKGVSKDFVGRESCESDI